MLSIPLNVGILQVLEQGPTPLMELRRAVGSPPQTTLRAYLRTLAEQGIVERRQAAGFPGPVTFELTRAGHGLLEVAAVHRRWLAEAPRGCVPLGSTEAKGTTKALVEGWSTNVIRALVARPLSLTELNRLISDVSYPSLERRLATMRLAGLIEPCPASGRGTAYRATSWLRRAMASVAASARWERRYKVSGAAPVGRLDIEAGFLLATPLIRLEDVSGTCRMAVELLSGGERQPAGVMLKIEAGAVVACVSRLQGDPNAWASGPVSAWLDAVVAGDRGALELGGDSALAEGCVDGLHGVLFGDGDRSPASAAT